MNIVCHSGRSPAESCFTHLKERAMVFTHSLYTAHYSAETGRRVEATRVDGAIAYAKLTSTLPLACRQKPFLAKRPLCFIR